MNTRKQLLLGSFFLAVAAVLGYFTLFMADVKFIGNPVKHSVYFSETNGLRLGSPVLVAGMRWGKVIDMTFSPDADFEERIEVVFQLDDPVEFKEDVAILIKDATLLGGKELSIEPGSATAAAFPADRRLYGRVQGNVVQELESFVAENREAVGRAIQNLEQVSAQLTDTQGTLGRLINDPDLAGEVQAAVEDIRAVGGNLKTLTDGVVAGEGTVGRLFQEDALYEDLQQAVNDFDTFSKEGGDALAKLNDPESGLIGRLVSDPEMSDVAERFLRDLEETMAKVNNGDGTLGRLVGDEEWAQRLDQILANADTFAAGLNGEESLLAVLTQDAEVAGQVREIVTNVQMASRGLVSPDSTVGRLLSDDALYAQLETALGTLQGTLEEAREAAPITTFISSIFLGF